MDLVYSVVNPADGGAESGANRQQQHLPLTNQGLYVLREFTFAVNQLTALVTVMW
ncbi:hypothetical protein ES703_74276 [subsurface metagenome]